MATNQPSVLYKSEIPFYRDERVLKAIAQIVSAALIIAAVVWAVLNFLKAAEARSMTLTFDFLKEAAGFPISNPPIEYEPSMTFGRAFLVGLVNTLLVSVFGVIGATLLGTLIALARLSSNWLLSRIALAYIEFHRNIPLLVLLFIWYFTVFAQLPQVADSIVWPGPIYISKRGFYLTWPRLTETGMPFVILLGIGVLAAIIVYTILRRRREITGKETYYFSISVGLLIFFPLIGWFLSGGTPLWLDVPVLDGFNYQGGLRFTPEFTALFVGLTMYTAAFIAEVVRAGIQAVDRGQIEAARAVVLSTIQVLSLVIIPQALRVIIPPMISQYLNLTKNSSLALAVGFQELFSVGKIAINQAGRAVPVFALVMITYLTMSLLTSFVLNIYNRRIQFVTR
ncbi:MAG: ABC transporter permease subunit [Chloroflexi bacterium]|nr:ABC transporter permease subunit [Chloroflexota bacterium]MBU1659890.1 ABC transporter permease subunit [Chloroflexota bacterium]